MNPICLANNKSIKSQSMQAKDNFIEKIQNKFHYTLTESPQKGDLVVYPNLLHFGIYIGEGMVESKWGAQGRVFQHPYDATPYGKCVYLRPPSKPTASLATQVDFESELRSELEMINHVSFGSSGNVDQPAKVDPCTLTIALAVAVISFVIFKAIY